METWGWVGFYLLHPTMTLGAFLGAVLFLPLVWFLPEDWGAVAKRSAHSMPSGTKQQRRREVLERRSVDKKLNTALTSPGFRYLRLATRVSGCITALQDIALIRSIPPLKHASVGYLVGSR